MATGGDDKAGSSKACQPYTPAGRWFFTKTELSETPSVKAGLPMTKEISYRQQAANFIQDMGQHLRVTQLCINTAIVYCQRFYMFHSFHRFHRNSIALAALFLAAKVEEQPRKLEHVIKMAHLCLNGRDAPPLDIRADAYQEKAQELVTNENILLQTLGFDVAIDHPHTHVVRCCQLVKASKELAQASYYLATNSLHLTTMCLRYSPTIVACFCIHLACKWSNYKIPLSAQNKEWFVYVDPTATLDLLEEMTVEFLTIYDQCPSRLKKKIKASTQAARGEEEQKQSGNPPLNANHFNGPPSQIQAPTAMPGQVTANSRPAENEQPRRVSNHQPRPSSHHPNVNQPMKIPHVPSTTMSNTHLPPANAYNAEKVAHGLHPPMPPSSLNLSHQKLPHDQLSKHQNWPHGSSHQKGMPVVPNQIQDPKSHSQRQQSQSRQQSSSSSSSRSNHSNSIPSSQTSRSGGNSSGMTQQKVSSHGQVPPGQHHSHHQQPPIHHSRSQSSTKVSSHVEMVGQPKLVPTQSLPAARQRTPPLKLPVTTERSIFDIDSPVKSINDPISTLPPVKSFFDSPKMEPPVRSMSHDTVPVKIETKDSLSSFGSLGSLPPKVSKRPSLFSPPSDSESKSSAVPIPPVVMPSNAYANSTNTFIKQEQAEEQKPVVHNSASEHRVQSQPVKVEQIKTEAIKIEKQSHEEEERREKKHKEKKKKKNKDKDKERDERHGGESTSSSSKKHKHKHKEKSKDRGDSDREKIPSSSSATPPVAVGGIKLKIKTLPPVAPEASQPPLAPLKISLAHVNGESDSHSGKRSRDESGSGIGPASKMSRVLGTSVEKEREFLHVVGGSGSSGHHLSSKSSKKVSSR